MKIFLILISIYFTLSTFGQTKEHIEVLGTKCSLIPPSGFEISQNFSGFQHNELGASIMINEFRSEYKKMIDGFTFEALQSKGMKLINKKTIKHNFKDATIIEVSQQSNGTHYLKQILIFETKDGTVMVNAIYPNKVKKIETVMLNSILTTRYNDTQTSHPIDKATFTIELDSTDFQFIDYLSDSYLFSTDSKLSPEKPILMIGKSVGNPLLENQQDYTRERYYKLPGVKMSHNVEMKEIIIDQLKGYELISVTTTDDKEKQLIYFVMLYDDDDQYYILLGRTKENHEDNLTVFKSIIRSFKRK